MIYLSKGLLLWAPADAGISVSHCGALHKLAGAQAALWLDGRHKPAHVKDSGQEAHLKLLAGLGIAECYDSDEPAAAYRLLTNCAICPARAKPGFALLNKRERRVWKWIRRAGLRPTIAELVFLCGHNIRPVPGLLGKDNRQALTEAIYTADTIPDGILEHHMERSPARDEATAAALGLLRKQKIYLL